MINCAGVILYAAEAATQVALDAIQCLGTCVIVGCTCVHNFALMHAHSTCYVHMLEQTPN